MMHYPIFYCSVALLAGLICGGEDERPVPSNHTQCRTLGQLRPGMSLHEMLAEVGPPVRVYLSGDDNEHPEPRATDNLYAVFQLAIPTPRSKLAVEALAEIPADGIRATTVVINLGNPRGDASFIGLSSADVAAWLGTPTLKFRRSVSDDGPEGFLSDCSDSSGSVETWVYRDSCTRVLFDRSDPLKARAWLIELTTDVESKVPPPCEQR